MMAAFAIKVTSEMREMAVVFRLNHAKRFQKYWLLAMKAASGQNARRKSIAKIFNQMILMTEICPLFLSLVSLAVNVTKGFMKITTVSVYLTR